MSLVHALQKAGAMASLSLLAGAASWLIVRFVDHGSDTLGSLALLVPGGAALLLMSARPVFAAMLFVTSAFINPASLPTLAEFGEFSVRYVDIVFGVMAIAVGMRIAIKHQEIVPREFWKLFAPFFPFLIYIGLSLANVVLFVPDFFLTSAASYLRFIETALFALLLQLVLRNSRDVNVFHKALIALCVATIAIGTLEALSSFGVGGEVGLSGRFGGLLGYNSFGLVSGLLVLYAVLLKRNESPRSMFWIGMLLAGLWGLILAKSASSSFATAGAVAVHMAAPRLQRLRVQVFVRGGAIAAVLFAAAGLAVWTWRQSDVVGLLNITGGSFAQRLMIAHAGLQMSFHYPLGVGWQASATEAFISSPTLNAALMEKFPGLPTHLFFLERPTSLHNMYIQFLAELGIVGSALFVYACLRTGKALGRIVRNMPAGSPYNVWARFYALGLLFLLIWWNTNPLFGGQTESVLAFTFLSGLATVARLERCRGERG